MSQLATELELELLKEECLDTLPLSFHSSFPAVYKKLKKWHARFPSSADGSLFNDLTLHYILSTKKFFDHRKTDHLARAVLSIHVMQKKLLRAMTFSPHMRHLQIRWIPANLRFPFSSRPVFGCLIGFNLLDRYEVFDEENIVLALQKHLPQLRLVKESSYCHTSQHKDLKIFYFEIEKRNGQPFSLSERNLLKKGLEQKVRKSIQQLSPTIFMGMNDEESYKNVLVLSQEIQCLSDLPQAYIALDQQTGKEIIFRVTLVHISPFHRFSLKEHFFNCSFVSQRVLTVRHIDNHPVEAHIFQIHLERDPSLLRSDGSLDFYSARQKVVSLMINAIGEFRDYNGGILLKQQELLQSFKQRFPEVASSDPEALETFFYALTPLEKQVVLSPETLETLFNYYQDSSNKTLPHGKLYSLELHRDGGQTFLVIHAGEPSITQTILKIVQEHSFTSSDIAYNILESGTTIYFNCVFLKSGSSVAESIINELSEALEKWNQKMLSRQVLRVGLEYSVVSLDPRIGGESVSGGILRLLFEGLTRYNQNGRIENAVAESIEISPNLREYVFKLRSSALWNDGTPVTAHDFEYAWKKVLSPDFKTAFAYLFYPIKNAQAAKEGKVSLDQVGIQVISDRLLKVELSSPTPYFLESLALSPYSPIHRSIDQQYPQWPYASEKNYPCNGPFQLKVNQPNQGYQLIKNSFYWDVSQVFLDQIVMTTMNSEQGHRAFQQDEVDWIGYPFGNWYSFYNIGKEGKLVSIPDSILGFLILNTSKPPFSNAKLRQALAHALQRNELVSNGFMSLSPAYSVLLPHHRKSGSSFPDYNPGKARELFVEALEELEMRKEDLSLNFVCHANEVREQISANVKKQLRECLGIDCNVQALPWKSLFRKTTEGDFQLGFTHWTPWIDDPIYTLNTFKYANAEINYSKWEDTEFQRLLDLSEQEVNPFARSSHLLKAEAILSKEMPVIPLYYQPMQALVKKDLQGICQSFCAPFHLSKSYFIRRN